MARVMSASGGFEPERYSGDKPNFGVDRFGAAVRPAALDRSQNRLGVGDDEFL